MPRPSTAPTTPDERLRAELVALLRGGHAHVATADALAVVPLDCINERIDGVAHSLWDLLEHLRIAQVDILDFTRARGGPAYTEIAWPDAYWPDEPGTPEQWQATLDAFLADLDACVALAEDPSVDLFAPFEHAPGYTVLRELLLVADHNAHHLGQVITLRRYLDCWPPDSA
ncbi:MAG: DinB family protein [Bacteroidota bacterium]